MEMFRLLRSLLGQNKSRKIVFQPALKKFQPKIRLSVERYPYVIKTVERSWELESALRLRSRVFYEELLGRESASGIDMDTSDLRCDHLIIMDLRSSRFFGCASIHTDDPQQIAAIAAYLEEKGSVAKDLNVAPLPGYRLEDHRLRASFNGSIPTGEARRFIPPLLQSYLRMGAIVGRDPAVDKDFYCVDFLTILETSRLSASYERKFVRAEN